MSETLLPRISRDRLDPKWHLAWDTLNSLTGTPQFVEVFAAAPEMLDFVMNKFYGPVFFGGKVGQRYKQLARLKLSLVHGCRTCNKQNIPGALEAGFSQAQIDSLSAGGNEGFDAAERAVIDYAQEVALTNMDGNMSRDLYQRLRKHFSDEQILELGTTMAIISGMAKLSFVLNVVEKENYCRFATAAA
ncbi:MAG: carboxymuconolactone decarboxylase family protein [Steroidobacteraceae bacterium]